MECSFAMWKILCDVTKYSMTCHGILYLVTCMDCCKINNGLLTFNMGLVNMTL